MDYNCLVSSRLFARRESQENPLKRKRMDLAPEQPELQPKEKQLKKKRRETEEKDVMTEKTETCVEASCSVTRSVSKESPLKRKWMDAPPERPEPQPEEQKRVEKRKRTETAENDVKTGKTEKFFSRFTVGKLLGKGSFGFVYAGVQKSDGKKVALKFMKRCEIYPYITLPGDTRRLPLEVALMELVCKPPHCPHVIELLECFETPKFFILVLERPDPCVDLFEYCEDVGMSESKAQTIMKQVLLAALHCRDRGVFHRDIKDENVLLNPQTLEVKLIDFGCGDLLKDTPYTEYSDACLIQAPGLSSHLNGSLKESTRQNLPPSGVLAYSFTNCYVKKSYFVQTTRLLKATWTSLIICLKRSQQLEPEGGKVRVNTRRGGFRRRR
ncbi:serine/threonine-protein kinase pim-2-like isoform X1 [Ictalurus furcatus]|uniref:serine/threonine-protein kinase pim-2-like isoform X1 n=1 Tax=Ictalurus furcatus TaxID=66913 RepID=UPI002350F9A9|nr:serine/threonine-protein kinase pim-2-like isoform X1 [Ictalurus furcatus]